jgi:hypothetical protein
MFMRASGVWKQYATSTERLPVSTVARCLLCDPLCRCDCQPVLSGTRTCAECRARDALAVTRNVYLMCHGMPMSVISDVYHSEPPPPMICAMHCDL